MAPRNPGLTIGPAGPAGSAGSASATAWVRGLTRAFDGRRVLDRLDLDIAPGEFVAMLGVSGTGKSTLLRAIAGLDHEVTGTSEVPGAVAVAFQEPRLLPWRRVLARALVREPSLLLLDEPFSALDALTRIAMHRLVLRLWERHRPAVLLVTHDVDEALVLADRVLVLAGGRLAFSGPVDVPRPRDRDHPALIELRHELLRQLGVIKEGQ